MKQAQSISSINTALLLGFRRHYLVLNLQKMYNFLSQQLEALVKLSFREEVARVDCGREKLLLEETIINDDGLLQIKKPLFYPET